jgi:hypothetical protein
MVFSSGRSSANVKVLQDSVQRATSNINNSRPPEDAAKPPVEFFVDMNFKPINPLPYDTDNPWFVPSTAEDRQRRNPEVLLASNLSGEVVRGAIHTYVTVNDGNKTKVAVLADKNANASKPTKRQQKQIDDLKRQLKRLGLSHLLTQGGGGGGGVGGMPGGGFGGGKSVGGGMMGAGPGGLGMGPGGMAGGGIGGGKGLPGGPGGGGFGGGFSGGSMLGNAPGQRLPGMVRRMEYVDLDKIGDQTLAETLEPVRMIVINGSFPYRKQLEEFRSKLRKRSVTELMSLIESGEATFSFQGFVVERRVLKLDGTEVSPWQDYTKEMIENLTAMYSKAKDFQMEDQRLQEYGMINEGLVASRPQLARDAKYPPISVDSLNKAIESMDKQLTPEMKRPMTDLARKLKGGKGAFNPFNPFAPFKEEEEQPEKPVQTKPGDKTNSSEDPDADLVVPEHVLVRLIDFVQPGFSYEYRIKVKMTNPNYKQTKLVAYPALAKPEYLIASDWSVVPKVDVPGETLWYAVEPRADAEKVSLQLQKWIDYINPQSELSSTPIGVGDWSVSERETTYRGDFIGRYANVRVPVWSTENENYEFAHVRKGGSTVPVDFSTGTRSSSPAILVDFAGGKGHITKIGDRQVREDLPLELLVLNSDGKLILRNSVDDEENKERSAREEEWHEWINKVRSGNAGRQQQLTVPGQGPGGTSGLGGKGGR